MATSKTTLAMTSAAAQPTEEAPARLPVSGSGPLRLDRLIRARAIHSMTDEVYRAVGLRGAEIAAISADPSGLDDLAGAGTVITDAGDLTLLPAFAESHEHLMEASRNTLLVPVDRARSGRLVPFCMFLDPELARVGCNETEARRRGLGYRLLTLPMAAVLRTRTLSEPRGFLKMLIAADSDEILGFTAFGAEASELMAAVQVAMIGRMPYPALRAAIFTHPTAAEGLTVLLAGTPVSPGSRTS